MKCKDCKFLRTDTASDIGPGSVARKYGMLGQPCNRFPMNIIRHPDEPACGEFRPIWIQDELDN